MGFRNSGEETMLVVHAIFDNDSGTMVFGVTKQCNAQQSKAQHTMLSW